MRLSGGGWHVLRFDYYGTGDSAGEFEATTPDDWQADIEAAVGELDAISGTRSVQLVGVRLGATLAARAALRLPSVRRVVLGDPIYNGEGYLKQLAETHQRMLGPHYFDSGEHFGRRELVNVGDPPALPGRPSVFDVSGSNVRNSPREPLKHHAGESSMNNYRSLNHTKWECQYHVVFIPKYRRKTLYGGLRHYLGDVLRRLAEQRESRVEEGHLLADHVHMLVSIPPKYSVAQVIGYIKGKSAIHIAREFAGRPRNFVGQHFWARGYYVSTVGQDERVVREYVQQQEREDRRLEQLRLEE